MLIQVAFDNFFYEAADQAINDGLARWICSDYEKSLCIDYTLTVSTVYKKVETILTMCFAYYETIALGTS